MSFRYRHPLAAAAAVVVAVGLLAVTVLALAGIEPPFWLLVALAGTIGYTCYWKWARP